MAGNVVRVSLLADAKGFKKGFGEAEKATTNFEKTASGVSSAIKGFFAVQAVGAVVDFAQDSIKAFADLEQATGSVESVFGDAAQTIIDKSKEAATEFGLSATEFQTAAATIGSQLKNNLGLSADEAALKVEELMGRASDMAATFGGTTSDAISAIGSLLRGERDPIEKYGVAMNDAAIEAHALEMGLAGSNAELTPQMENAAALDLLYQQTADSAGQFARESDTVAGKQQRANAAMENAKAALGEGLVPAQLAFSDAMTESVIPAIVDASDFLMAMTGNLDLAESALREFNDEFGRDPRNADEFTQAVVDRATEMHGLVGISGEWANVASREVVRALEEEITSGEMNTDVLKGMKGAVQDLVDDEKILASEGDRLNGIIDLQSKYQKNYNREISDAERPLGAMEAAVEDVGTEVEQTTEAMRTQFDLIDGRLDTFGNYTSAVDDQAEAQKAVNEAIKKFGEGSPEHIAALEDVAGANRDVRDAEIAVREQGGLTREEFIKQQVELGLTYDEAVILANKYDELFTPRSVTHHIHINETRNQSSSGRTYRGGVQHGGPVLPHQPYLVGERGPEIFEPSVGGRVIPNRAIGGHMGGGAGTVVNITINAGLGADPNTISKAVVEALQRYQRNNGSVPIRVRG